MGVIEEFEDWPLVREDKIKTSSLKQRGLRPRS